jgi:hypothetical protein
MSDPNGMLDKETYALRLGELKELRNKVTLDVDPVASGIAEFTKKLADITSARTRIGSIFLEALWNRNGYQQEFNATEFAYQNKVNDKLKDVEISKLKSQDLRGAHVQSSLVVDLTVVKQKEADLDYADTYLQQVKNTAAVLEIINDNLIKQIDQVWAQLRIHPDAKDAFLTRKNTGGGTHEQQF